MPPPDTLGYSYLSLSLHDVVALAIGRGLEPGAPVGVDLIVDSIKLLAQREAARNAEIDAEQREWLAQQFDALTTEVP